MNRYEEPDRLEELQAEYRSNPSTELRQAIHHELSERSEATFDMDNLTPIAHHWVDRGAVISCEGAGHPNHRHFRKV